MTKYGVSNAALIRERASARETAVRTALFAFPLYLCGILGIKISSSVISLGGHKITSETEATKIIRKAAAAKDTLGGEFEIRVSGTPAGLGAYSQGNRRLGAKLFYAMAAINSVKSVRLGSERLTGVYGSEMNTCHGCTGGIDGGITNGGEISLTCWPG